MLRRLSPALLMVALTAACTPPPAREHSRRPDVRALAGDVVAIDGQPIHLANVDAPRPGAAARCWAEAALAQQATQRLGQIADLHRRFDVRRLGTDRDGRDLSLVSGDGQDLGEAMISAGLAVEATGSGWDWCAHPNAGDDRGLWLGALPLQQAARHSTDALITRARAALAEGSSAR